MGAQNQVKEEERQKEEKVEVKEEIKKEEEEVEKQQQQEENNMEKEEEVEKKVKEEEVKEEEEKQQQQEEKKAKEDNVDSKSRHSCTFTEKISNKIKKWFCKMFCIFCGLSYLLNALKKIKEKLTRAKEEFTEKLANKANTDTLVYGDSHQKQLELKKQNFGKIQRPHSCHELRELLKLGESVCLLKINIFQFKIQGTGFLLFDNLILTNAHLFEECTSLKRGQWKKHVKITATFNYESPDCDSNNKEFTAQLLDYIGDLDCAILELNDDSQSSNQTAETQEVTLPPGLLSKFAPPPPNGEACLIGHPAGGVKQMDHTCIITKKDREQAVYQNLEEYRDYIFTLYAINQEIRKDPYADIFVTYNTSMYHGASGSPVFDAHGRVFGLHTGGFFFGFVRPNHSVIEFAVPLLTIFENFVRKLKKTGNKELFVRVLKAGKGNPFLEQIIDAMKDEEPMQVN